MRLTGFILVQLSLFVILCGCGNIQNAAGGDGNMNENTYNQISQEEAKVMMEKDDGHIVVDVRRQDEYDGGHIPGAILIPNESIGTEQPAELPDLDQIILVYCRSGNRSKQASKKLAAMGYTNIYEFGGINDWTGDVVVD
ncbi:MAG: rhodanese-like domain-containing protein [Lachnospiraceae bacterium]|nr:rhodanese-like domain-containing protein [Lachnospiraceae bacterium]